MVSAALAAWLPLERDTVSSLDQQSQQGEVTDARGVPQALFNGFHENVFCNVILDISHVCAIELYVSRRDNVYKWFHAKDQLRWVQGCQRTHTRVMQEFVLLQGQVCPC